MSDKWDKDLPSEGMNARVNQSQSCQSHVYFFLCGEYKYKINNTRRRLDSCYLFYISYSLVKKRSTIGPGVGVRAGVDQEPIVGVDQELGVVVGVRVVVGTLVVVRSHQLRRKVASSGM